MTQAQEMERVQGALGYVRRRSHAYYNEFSGTECEVTAIDTSSGRKRHVSFCREHVTAC